MKPLTTATALVSALTATAAYAAPTISFSTTAPGGASVQDFDGFAPGTTIPSNTLILDTTIVNVGVIPTGSTGNYAAVLGGGNYTVTFAPAKSFSFLLGSLDSYNQLTLSFDDATMVSYSGSAITGGANGDGYVTYTSTGPRIIGATFASSINSFEIDNLTSSVPEPAAWALMIMGFGGVGALMRRRKFAVTYA